MYLISYLSSINLSKFIFILLYNLIIFYFLSTIYLSLNLFINLSLSVYIFKLIPLYSSRFGSVVAHPDLDGEGSGSSPGHTKKFKMILTAPQPVLVLMILSKGNALAIDRRSLYPIHWTSRQRWYKFKELVN